MKFREERLKKITLQGKAEGNLSLKQLNHTETRLYKAMLQFPECFTKVPMIYLRAQINGVDVLALLDTGAQMSIISATAVEKCKMTDAVDRRFRVTASGVGGMRSSAGRILACTVQFTSISILCSFDVLSSDICSADVIIGVDVFTKYQAVLNFAERTIQFGRLGTAAFMPPEEAEKFVPFSVLSRNDGWSEKSEFKKELN
ncbi:unnamed protein product [Angiostrongylus costaricensis]|uniref:Peptidase A2 domain-containing protein n=1 Tax=Angiostrongylus costaricensis TaxID=334426 RepID=A0A158PM99_ANGCS|nr:unnamed protein product [Angiostrongylus costaricensis]